MRVRVCTLGERCHVASNGDLVQIASFGANARIANCGDNVHIIASGENSTVVSTGVVDSIILGPGDAPHSHIMTAKEFALAVAIEGENNIRAGVRYRLNEQHQFVEC